MATDRRQQPRTTVYRAEDLETGKPWEVEYDSVAEALHFACRDLREKRRTPLEIVEDGVRILDAGGIAEACARHDAEHRLHPPGRGADR